MKRGVYPMNNDLDLYSSLSKENYLAAAFTTCSENSSDGFLFVNNQGRISYINKPYCDYIGVRFEDIVGKPVTEIISKSRLAAITKDINFIPEHNVVFEVSKNQYIDKERYVVVNRSNIVIDGKSYGAVAHVKFIRSTLEISSAIHDVYEQLEYYKDELRRISAKSYSLEDILGNSPKIEAVKTIARKASQNDFSVLLTGGTGVGKEVFANAIHYASLRKTKPFIRINCAAIPSELMESELFGYFEGSFTGAKKGGKKGKFELANGGTIFLDEIGELPIVMQAKLLRVLQEHEVEPLGSSSPIPLNIRIIAATNKDLRLEIKEKRFREDLYYRLSVIEIYVPALKERKKDIPLYIHHFLHEINEKYHSKVTIDTDTLHLLLEYRWPGNLRELKNTISRCYTLSENSTINRYALPSNILHSAAYANNGEKSGAYLPDIVKQMERWLILEEIQKNKGNLRKTADKLGIHRTTLYKKMDKLGISRAETYQSTE
jgi:PAS domain S-box-containing protein